jgi:hypothetical protein
MRRSRNVARRVARRTAKVARRRSRVARKRNTRRVSRKRNTRRTDRRRNTRRNTRRVSNRRRSRSRRVNRRRSSRRNKNQLRGGAPSRWGKAGAPGKEEAQPEPEPGAVAPDFDPRKSFGQSTDLPDGWISVTDAKTQKAFYVYEPTGKSLWDLPTEEQVEIEKIRFEQSQLVHLAAMSTSSHQTEAEYGEWSKMSDDERDRANSARKLHKSLHDYYQKLLLPDAVSALKIQAESLDPSRDDGSPVPKRLLEAVMAGPYTDRKELLIYLILNEVVPDAVPIQTEAEKAAERHQNLVDATRRMRGEQDAAVEERRDAERAWWSEKTGRERAG